MWNARAVVDDTHPPGFVCGADVYANRGVTGTVTDGVFDEIGEQLKNKNSIATNTGVVIRFATTQ